MIKKAISMLCIIAFFLAVIPKTVKAESQTFEYQLVYYSGLRLSLKTPWYVNASSSFNITFIVEAAEANLQDIEIRILNVTTFINETEYSISEPFNFTIDELKIGEQQEKSFNINLPQNASKVVLGEMSCEWQVPPHGLEKIPYTNFIIAIISDYWKQKAEQFKKELDILQDKFENLSQTYHDLNQTYYDLKANYTNLEEDYRTLEDDYRKTSGELGATRQLTIIFGVMTVFFVITTLYLYKRKPQVW